MKMTPVTPFSPIGAPSSGEPVCIIRPAVSSDAARVASIWHAGWHDAHDGRVPPELAPHRTEASFSDLARSRSGLTSVAEVADEVVGFVVVRDDEIEQLYVHASGRGSGVARALIATAEAAIAIEHAVAWLAVVAGNDRALRFYQRCGWVDSGGIDYEADAGGTVIAVPARRYEKVVTSPAIV